MDKLMKIIKIACKWTVTLVAIALALIFIYCGVEFVFANFLSFSARAVLANFIVFALIIGIVLRQVVHPKAMLEQEQTVIENQIKDSETVKTASEERLSTIEDSMANVEKEIDSIISASNENAKLVGEKILKDGEKTALIIKENTEKVIENSCTILKNDLLKRASLASIEIAKTHIINELSWNQGLHDKLIDESIEALEGVNQ